LHSLVAPGLRVKHACDDPSLLKYLDQDCKVNNDTLYRLREGVERFFITDINIPPSCAHAQSDIAIAHDATHANVAWNAGDFYHIPGGGNVIYLDGHVRFVRYPSAWPIGATWPNLQTVFQPSAP